MKETVIALNKISSGRNLNSDEIFILKNFFRDFKDDIDYVADRVNVLGSLVTDLVKQYKAVDHDMNTGKTIFKRGNYEV